MSSLFPVENYWDSGKNINFILNSKKDLFSFILYRNGLNFTLFLDIYTFSRESSKPILFILYFLEKL